MKRIMLAGLALLATSAGGTARAEEFRIGLVMSLTGPNAEVGKLYIAGANAGIAMVNARGGIGGMQARLVTCDTQSVEQQAVICARKLALQDKVNMLMGSGSTPQTMAMLPTIEAAGIPTFSIAAGNVTYNPMKKWVFKGLAGNDDFIPVIMAHLKAKGWTRAALIRDNGPFGADTAATVKARAAEAGIEIVADEVYSPTDTDMTAQVTRIRGTKPDVVLNMAITPPPGAMIARTAVQLGITAPLFVGANLQSDAFARISGDAAAQTIFVGSKVILDKVAPGDPLHDNITDFQAAFAKVNPDIKPSSLSPAPADGMLLAQAAAKDLGTKALDPNALRAALETLRDVPGLQGVWTLSPTDHGSVLRNGIALVRIEGGKWVAAN